MLFLCLAIALMTQEAFSDDVTLALTSGAIYTMDPAQPLVEAVAIAGDRIVAAGSNAAVLRFATRKTRIISLGGKMVLPGFIEGHGHLLGLGQMQDRIDLRDTRNIQEIVTMAAAKAKLTSKGRWVLGYGWDQNRWHDTKFPTVQELSQAVPNHPVKLTRVDYHAAWYNDAALKLAGINAATKDPIGGRILRDATGNPTGVLLDTAMTLVDHLIPAPRKDDLRYAFKLGMKRLAALGITSFHDVGVDDEQVAVFKEMLTEGSLTARFNLMIASTAKNFDRYLDHGPEVDLGNGFLTVRGIKVWADGALGSRGAAMLQDYQDETGHNGLLLVEKNDLAKLTVRALKRGFQVATHAIGDRANRMVIDAYEQALHQVEPSIAKNARLRLEHAQLMHPDDVKRLAPLGIIASMQPTHCTSDMGWVAERVGEPVARTEAYVWQNVLQNNAHLVFGSDVPVEDPNPLLGIYSALYRQDLNGKPDPGWYPEQRMKLDAILNSYTYEGAYAQFAETQKGRIAPGYWADLVVLARDLHSASRVGLLQTRVLMTMVGGTIVYKEGMF